MMTIGTSKGAISGTYQSPTDAVIPSVNPTLASTTHACLEETVCRVQAYLDTLLRAWHRKSWMWSVNIRPSMSQSLERLESTAWRYSRVAQLWQTRDKYDRAWQSEAFRDSFTDRILQICSTLTSWTESVRSCRGPFLDHTTRISALESLVDSLENFWKTWCLYVDIHKYAMADSAGLPRSI